MGLFTLHNCCVSRLLNLLKLKLDSQSCLTIPEFSGYHCKLFMLYTFINFGDSTDNSVNLLIQNLTKVFRQDIFLLHFTNHWPVYLYKIMFNFYPLNTDVVTFQDSSTQKKFYHSSFFVHCFLGFTYTGWKNFILAWNQTNSRNFPKNWRKNLFKIKVLGWKGLV